MPEVLPGGSDPLGEFSDFQLRADPLAVDHQVVGTSQVPLMNLALAKRVLSAGCAMPAMEEFVGAMSVFFMDFVPLRAAWTHAVRLADEAQRALTESEEVAAFAASLESIGKPHCMDIEGVKTAAAHAMDKVQQLARHGVALPAMYVEYVRQAIDDAGMHLLANPPAAEPDARIRWSEAAIAIQLAPIPHVSTALKGIAHSLSAEDLEQLVNTNSVPSTECVRLLGAVIWTIQPECRCNPSWVEVKLALADAAKFLEQLQAWSPMSDGSVARITRSRDLLLGNWSWAAAGCDGSPTLGSLFAWISLVVASLPITDMAQRLTPVYKSVKQGIAKSLKVSAQKQRLAKTKAWNAALFLLDGAGEHWWWLGLIRPTAHMDMPWTDSEDGGVSESHPNDHADEERPRREQMSAQSEQIVDPGSIGEADAAVDDIGLDDDIGYDEYMDYVAPDTGAEEDGELLDELEPSTSPALGPDTTEHGPPERTNSAMGEPELDESPAQVAVATAEADAEAA